MAEPSKVDGGVLRQANLKGADYVAEGVAGADIRDAPGGQLSDSVGRGNDPRSQVDRPEANGGWRVLLQRIGRSVAIGLFAAFVPFGVGAGMLVLKGGGMTGYFFIMQTIFFKTGASPFFYLLWTAGAIWAFFKVKE